MRKTPIIELKHFIQAIRDAGYRGTSSALAELIDNSFEADAITVAIEIISHKDSSIKAILVVDDGHGMDASLIKTALQFGGSDRFNSRHNMGRYGMGLPNSSVSQSRRLDVFSWKDSKSVCWSYLGIDEIISGYYKEIPTPKLIKMSLLPIKPLDKNKGTIIKWSKCDRLSYKKIEPLKRTLHKDLGKIFRKQIWKGKNIIINGEKVQPIDPLFINNNKLEGRASIYGSELDFNIRPISYYKNFDIGTVKVVFSELPIEEWYYLSNQKKRIFNISKNAGVSIIRSGREIDYGWFFMGSKRKENYDDWWRCEISFEAELDEFFGVTHTKQGIYPLPELLSILSPEIESIAHKLNSRVRAKFVELKKKDPKPSEKKANNCDIYFEPPLMIKNSLELPLIGMEYNIIIEELNSDQFYKTHFIDNKLELILNKHHPFVQRFYIPLSINNDLNSKIIVKNIELFLIGAARAEIDFDLDNGAKYIYSFKNKWSDILSAYFT